MTVGIYKIECTKNNCIYIGQSSNIESRIAQHFWLLQRSCGLSIEGRKHSNITLTNDYNEYGRENFIWEILEKNIQPYQLIYKEHVWIEKYIQERGWQHVYNMTTFYFERDLTIISTPIKDDGSVNIGTLQDLHLREENLKKLKKSNLSEHPISKSHFLEQADALLVGHYEKE